MKPLNEYFTNSEDPEMQHNAAFHQGLHCLCKKNFIFFFNYNLTPLDMYNGLSQIFCFKSISIERVKTYCLRDCLPLLDSHCSTVQNNTNCSNDWWKTLKTFIKPSQFSSIPPIKVNGTINSDKANILNDYFTEQSSLDDSNATLPEDLDHPDFTLNSISVTANEVEAVLKSLQIGKVAGPDAINNRILQKLAQPSTLPLCDLFNASLIKGKV